MLIKGKIDKKSGRKKIFGYMLDLNSDASVNGYICIDNEKFAIECNIYSENLEKKYSHGKHCFAFSIPEKFKDKDIHHIRLLSDTGSLIDKLLIPLPNFTFSNYHETVCGYISDDIKNNISVINGVLINKNDNKDIRTAIIKLNDLSFEVKANLRREKPADFQSFISNAFSVTITSEQLRDLDNIINIVLLDKESGQIIDQKNIVNPFSDIFLSSLYDIKNKWMNNSNSALFLKEIKKLASKNTKTSDFKFVSALCFIYEKNVEEFSKILSELKNEVDTPLIRLFCSYLVDNTEYEDSSLTEYQLDLLRKFILTTEDWVDGYIFFSKYFPKEITNEYILKAFDNGMTRGASTFCLYLLEHHKDCFTEKNNYFDNKIKVYKKVKAHYKVIETILDYKSETGNKKHDFELINQFMKLHNFDKAYELLNEKKDDLEKSKIQDHRLYARFCDFWFMKGDYSKALDYVNQGLLIKPDNKELLQNKVKLLSTLDLNVEGSIVARKLCELYPSPVHTDMMNIINFKQNESIRSNCAWCVDLCNIADIDEAICLTEQFFLKFNRNTPFSVNKILFLCNKEPSSKIPNLNIYTDFARVFSRNEAVHYLQNLSNDDSIDWVGYVQPVANFSEIISDEIKFFQSVGVREGMKTSNILSLCRRTVLSDYIDWYKNSNHILDIPHLLDEFSKTVLCVGKNNNKNISLTKRIVFITPIGMSNFGGVEQFLQGMVSCFEKNFSYEPYIIALSDRNKASCKLLDRTYFSKEMDVKKTREILFDLSPDIVWSLTDDDMSPYVEPVRYLRSQSIIGLHYYRAFMVTACDGDFYCDSRNIVRKSFKDILSSVDVVYANSVWTQRLILNSFDVVLPVLFSLPHKYSLCMAPIKDRKFVLSVNTEFKKGFDFVVEIAKRLPEVPFVSLSNQSNVEVASEYCKRNGVKNITILPFQEKMEDIYSKSKVVLVPSFKFLETFSRVPIEAHCFGIPVIGSDTGNIPYILEKSGLSLPESIDSWVQELKRLFSDEQYYEQRSEKAFENARDRYNFTMQPLRINSFRSYYKKRCLVALGSGIGNMVLGSVVVRKLSEYFGTPIDIVIDGVPKSSAIIFANSPYVNAVYYGYEIVRHRYYDIVFITRCYTRELTYSSYNANKIYRTRDIIDYIDMRGIQETEAELKALEYFLEIPYSEEDNYLFAVKGNPFPLDVHPKRIGIHAGCKPGYWTKKQWPYFKELIVKLQSAGYEVVSLGVPDEYVEGTINGTSYETWDMVNNIQQCAFLVANDSGIAHLAKALGKHGVVIFGPTYSAKLLPYSEDWKVMHANDVPCSPCFMHPDFETRECNKSCMTHISAEEVFNAVVQGMTKIKEEK